MRILIIILLFVFTASLSANTLYVDNKYPLPGGTAENYYPTLQAAHNAAYPGDVIYVMPSPNPYEAIEVTKTLTIIGSGWVDPSETHDISEIISTMWFTAGSEGSLIKGLKIAAIYVNINNIEIKRNSIPYIHVLPNSKNIIIDQNFIKTSSQHAIAVEENSTVSIFNNIIWTNNSMGRGYCIDTYGGDGSESSFIIKNNLLITYDSYDYALEMDMANFIIINNIIIGGKVTYNNNGDYLIHHNICNHNQLPNGFNNIENVHVTTIFVDWTNQNFHLLPDSPARGSGYGGTDMGIYGGSFPFVDGGYPDIPIIIELEADYEGTWNNGLDVQIKAKSNR